MRDRTEKVVAGLLTALTLVLHVVFFLSAGPLWRDEAGSLHIATFPSDLLWQRLNLESFPLLWPLLLRLWSSVFGQSLPALRFLGFLMGIAIVAALWLVSRQFGLRAPVLSLAVVAMSGAVIRFGDAVRGYGSSCLTALLVVGAMLSASRSDTRRAWMLATVAAVIAVQTAFLNAVVVFAACVASMAVSRKVLKPFAAGCAAAASLLVYVDMFRARAVWATIDTPHTDLQSVAAGAFGTLAKNGAMSAWLVSGVIVASIILTMARLQEADISRRFALATVLVLSVGQALALLFLHLRAVPWYFVSWLAVAGICSDVLFASSRIRSILAVIVIVVGLSTSFAYVSLSSTNAGLIARAIQTLSKPGDLVVVYPWYCGVTLAPDLHQPWMTVPPIADHTVHRFDLVQEALNRSSAMDPLLRATAATLGAGHRVWLAGFPLGSESSGRIDPRDETAVNRADRAWSNALRETLRANARRAMLVVRPDPGTIANERMQLVVFER